MVAARRIPLADRFRAAAKAGQERNAGRFARLGAALADTGGASHEGA